MQTPQNIADAIGRKTLAESLGVGITAVNNAVARGWFPPAWYLVVLELSNTKGIECHADLFRMKSPSQQPERAK
jgi:hypothetical protein